MTVTQAEGFPGSKIAEKVETCTQTQDLLARVAKRGDGAWFKRSDAVL